MTRTSALTAANRVRQLHADRDSARINRRHFAQLWRLAALSRRGRLDAPRVTAGERAALDLVWRQHQRYRRLERYLAAAARLSRNA